MQGENRWVPAASLVGLTLVPLGYVHLGFGIAGAALAAVSGGMAIRLQDSAVLRTSVLALLLALGGTFGLPFTIWIAIGLMVLGGTWLPVMRPAEGWIPQGRTSRAIWWLTGLVVVGAGVGLAVWALNTDSYGATTLQLVDTLRELPGAMLGLALVVFVVVNATTEEIAYRGIAYESGERFLRPVATVIATSVAFSTLHVAGFPAGAVGVGLSFVYGLGLGAIRHLSAGLRFPILAHMAADATIALLVLTLFLPE